MIRFEAAYTEAMVAEAARVFISRRLPLRALGVLICAVWACAGLLAWGGGQGWIVGVLVSIPLLAVGVAGAAWRAQLMQSRARLRRMDPAVASITLGPHGMDVASSLGRAAVPWSTVTEVWVRPGFWMVFTAPNSYNIVPSVSMPRGTLELVRTHVPVR